MAVNLGDYGKNLSYTQFVSKMIDNQMRIIQNKNEYLSQNNNLIPMEYITSIDNQMNVMICPEPNTLSLA